MGFRVEERPRVTAVAATHIGHGQKPPVGAQAAQIHGDLILFQQFHISAFHKGLFPVAQRQFVIGLYQGETVPLGQPVRTLDKEPVLAHLNGGAVIS